MSSIGTGYDLSASQFSPDGRVFQVEYAQKAVENSGTAIALVGKDGVVFAVEKIVSSNLYLPGTNKRIFTVDEHVGLACAGLLADARAIVDVARNEAANFRGEYGVPIGCKFLSERVANYLHAYSLYSAVRPYGCAVIVASYLDRKPAMHVISPSGHIYGSFGAAIGKAKQNAKTEIEKLKLKELTCKQLLKEAAKIIYMGHDPVKDKKFELEMSWVCADSAGRHEAVPEALLKEAEAGAVAEVEEDTSDEEM